MKEGLVELEPGVRVLPLRTTTLPPATHTNAYILGFGALSLIDPGASDASEQQRLDDALSELAHDGHRLARVVLTHHHRDHCAGAARFVARGVPIWAHRASPSCGLELDLERELEDGDRLDLEPGDDAIEVVHCPGHTRDHIGLFVEPSSAFLCGDLMASVGTIVVSPPDGSMSAYFASLRDAREREIKLLLPAHGEPIVDARGHIEHYLRHRLARENQVVAALRNRPGSRPDELVPAIYTDVPVHVWPLAARNVFAHLEKLADDDRAVLDSSGGWTLTSPD